MVSDQKFYKVDEVTHAYYETFVTLFRSFVDADGRQINHLDAILPREMVHNNEQTGAFDVPLAALLEKVQQATQLA